MNCGESVNWADGTARQVRCSVGSVLPPCCCPDRHVRTRTGFMYFQNASPTGPVAWILFDYMYRVGESGAPQLRTQPACRMGEAWSSRIERAAAATAIADVGVLSSATPAPRPPLGMAVRWAEDDTWLADTSPSYREWWPGWLIRHTGRSRDRQRW